MNNTTQASVTFPHHATIADLALCAPFKFSPLVAKYLAHHDIIDPDNANHAILNRLLLAPATSMSDDLTQIYAVTAFINTYGTEEKFESVLKELNLLIQQREKIKGLVGTLMALEPSTTSRCMSEGGHYQMPVGAINANH